MEADRRKRSIPKITKTFLCNSLGIIFKLPNVQKLRFYCHP